MRVGLQMQSLIACNQLISTIGTNQVLIAILLLQRLARGRPLHVFNQLPAPGGIQDLVSPPTDVPCRVVLSSVCVQRHKCPLVCAGNAATVYSSD